MALGQEPVQGMAELMEGRLDIVHAQKGRFRLGRSREIADVDDNRTDTFFLVPEIVHPCAAALGLPHEIIDVEDAEEASVPVGELVRLHDRIVHLNLRGRLDMDAIDLFSRGENALEDTVHLEIRLGQTLVQGIFPGTDFLGIVGPVPRLDLVAGDRLHVRDFFLRLLHGRIHDGLKESIDRLGIPGHLVRKLVSGKVGISQEGRLLRTKLQDFQDDGVVVVLSPVVAAGGIGLEGLLAEGAVLTARHEIRIAADRHTDRFLEGIVLGEEVLSELLAQRSQPGVDFGETLLPGLVEGHTVADKGLVELLRDHLLFAGQPFGSLIDRLHALKESLIHEDFILGSRHERHDLLLNGLHFGGGIRFGEIEKHAADFGEQGSGTFVSRHGILEGRRFGVVQDGLNLGFLLLDTGLERRHVVCCFNPAEGSRSVGSVPLLEERVGAFAACCHGCHTNQNKGFLYVHVKFALMTIRVRECSSWSDPGSSRPPGG